ncbi:hypothetical protein KQX54_011728 [Cotesia glomerata]|uniref:Uncharacterized protein n=1 Tax=Cotesia glomerata TaxID=32391 RepID=A0AAV7IG65_COTGL|nr:hypothetical protein KQX54_011728 [Cotesia glomerata]
MNQSKPAATDNDSTQLKTKVKQLQRQIDVKNKMIIVKDDQIKQLKKKYDDAMNLNHRLQLQVIDGQRSAVGIQRNFSGLKIVLVGSSAGYPNILKVISQNCKKYFSLLIRHIYQKV